MPERGRQNRVHRVNDCPRCGRDHGYLEFYGVIGKDIDIGGARQGHWAECPFTGDPILPSEVGARWRLGRVAASRTTRTCA